MESQIRKIKKIASDFRRKIISGEIKFIGSNSFPSGCCGNASELLQRVLISKGFSDIKLIMNKWRAGQSHAWLEYEGYIIDITADQFSEQKGNSIIVIEKNKSNFHSEFISD